MVMRRGVLNYQANARILKQKNDLPRTHLHTVSTYHPKRTSSSNNSISISVDDSVSPINVRLDVEWGLFKIIY